MKNYYEILDIPYDADENEIKATYKKLALKWHPDKNSKPEATKVFKEIQQAYDTLKDPIARQIYNSKIQIPSFKTNHIPPHGTAYKQYYKGYRRAN